MTERVQYFCCGNSAYSSDDSVAWAEEVGLYQGAADTWENSAEMLGVPVRTQVKR